MRLVDGERVSGRLFILCALIGAPLCHLLIDHQYGFLYPEVFVVGLVVLAGSVAAAYIATRPIVFYAMVLVIVVLQSSNAVHVGFFPDVSGRARAWILLGVAAAIGTVMALMRMRFFITVVLVYLAGVLSVDAVKALAAPVEAFVEGAEVPSGKSDVQRVVYIVFDELIGIEGFPSDVEGSLQAKRDLEEVLLSNNFTVYPFAFSNYTRTRDSLPSIVNNQLLNFTGEYFDEDEGRNGLRKNLLFETYRKRGYTIRVYQSDYIDFARPQADSIVAQSYKSDDLAAMHSIRMDWTQRLYQIATIYLQSDQLWWSAYRALLPAWLQPSNYRMGPLAIRRVWPSALVSDIKAARQDTLFFAHLLSPHYPYVYRKDGTVRGVDEWFHDDNLDFYRESEYLHWYRDYVEQVEFLTSQLREFLGELRVAGIYDSTTLILHGDHGSRIRLMDEGQRAARTKLLSECPKCPDVNRYDYVSAPPLRDLLSRFSTLLAIKLAGASQPSEVSTKGSVLSFLRGVVWPRQAENEGINSVYLFDAEGRPREIPLLAIWQDRSGE
jgi:hypothetical protein